MEIKRNHADTKLWLNQRKSIETILHKLNMQECKLVKVCISIGARLSTQQFPKTQEEEDMSHVPYASFVGSIMYAIVCTRPYISHVVVFFSKYMLKMGKEN